MSAENNKRIAKNTMMLYIRMLLTMFVSLYTSRVVLNVLGVEDFGIYNVVGGVVTMFSFLNSAMAVGTQRFLSFEIGRNDRDQLSKVFITSVNIHASIAILVVLFSETIGLWFLNTHLTIPAERIIAANWVYQFSILSFAVAIFTVPYNASIIANERMSFYAYVSIFEVILKLIIVFLLGMISFDKLKLYGFLILMVAVIVFFIYRFYAVRNFKECKYYFKWDKPLFKEMLGYTGWNLFGNGAYVSYNQGVNILLNLFFGPSVNAARGIAYQVHGAINGFVGNFQIALNPQITKTYAAGNKDYMHQLIFGGSKYAFFLLFCVSLPVLIETEYILRLWLKIVPDYAVLFCRLVLINALLDSMSFSTMAGVQATGNIKWYQIIVGGLLLLILPISYIFLKFDFQPQITLYVSITIAIMALMARLNMASRLFGLSIKRFFKEVIIKVVIITLLSPILPLLLHFWRVENLLWVLLTIAVSFSSAFITIYGIGLTTKERMFLRAKINEIVQKIKP